MSGPPTRKFFSTQELAEYWSKSADEIDHFYSEVGLRRAFRLSREKISHAGTFIGSDEVSVTVSKSGKPHKDEWVYIDEISEARRTDASLLVGDKPEYPHPDMPGEQFEFVEGSVRRVTLQNFSGEPLSVVLAKEKRPLEVELGFLDQEPVVTIEEVERVEQGKSLSVASSISGVERENLLKVIALLTLELSERAAKFKSSEGKPNSSQIAETIHERLPQDQDSPKVDTIRKKIAEAMKFL